MQKQYDMVIGLEVHVELSTKTKIFCGCSTAFGAAPNTQICPVCTGMPGSLPVLNQRVLEYAVMTGLATNCQIRSWCRFDRKNYFYPDNPQNYQISQLYLPICHDGWLDIEAGGQTKRVRIHEIHMEEDAGKLVHDVWEDVSLVDYNRSGVPLLEIVSEPDMSSAEEVIAYLEKLRLILQYLGVSDCKLNEGSMRADVNLSVRERGSERLGVRTEMKNLNSFKAIARAIGAEAVRQIELLEEGKPVVQETRRWDDNKESSRAMRSKEDARDYRYFPDPDLPPVQLALERIEALRARLPELREEKCRRYQEALGLPAYDADILTQHKHLTELFEAVLEEGVSAKELSNYFMVEGMRILKEQNMDWEQIDFTPTHMAELFQCVEEGRINRTVAKQVFEAVFLRDVDTTIYIEENGLEQVQDEQALEAEVRAIVEAYPQSVADFKAGKTKAKGFIVGQTMRAMKGKADPRLLNELVDRVLAAL